MNRKGQLTADTLFAILGTILFISAMQTLVSGMNESQKEIAIANQEILIANDLREIIQSMQALSDGEFKIEYVIPMLIVPGKEEKQGCNIVIEQNKITVSYSEEALVVERTITFTLSNKLKTKINLPKKIACGEKISLGELS